MKRTNMPKLKKVSKIKKRLYIGNDRLHIRKE